MGSLQTERMLGKEEKESCVVWRAASTPPPSLQTSSSLYPHRGTVCLASPGFFSIPPHPPLKPGRGPRQTAGLVIVTVLGRSCVCVCVCIGPCESVLYVNGHVCVLFMEACVIMKQRTAMCLAIISWIVCQNV